MHPWLITAGILGILVAILLTRRGRVEATLRDQQALAKHIREECELSEQAWKEFKCRK